MNECDIDESPAQEWTSGVGGAQCDECYRTTIVQGFDEDFMGEATRYLCRPCALGLWDETDAEL